LKIEEIIEVNKNDWEKIAIDISMDIIFLPIEIIIQIIIS